MKQPFDELDRAKSVEVFQHLAASMPDEALHADSGRGFTLTSIKAAYVLERLSETFGLLGYGWRYAVSRHRREVGNDKPEILVEVALQWRIKDAQEGNYCPPVYWDRHVDTDGAIAEDWFLARDQPAVWSEPVFATGGSAAERKGSVPLTDAHRAATTNAITKAAARLGVGLAVFKGQEDPPGRQDNPTKRRSTKRAPAAPRKKAPAKNAQPARENGPPQKWNTLEAVQQAAKIHLEKAGSISGGAQPEMIKNLAIQMKKAGLKMQPMRLLLVLFGPGELTARRVAAAYNTIVASPAEGIEALNKAAFEEPFNKD